MKHFFKTFFFLSLLVLAMGCSDEKEPTMLKVPIKEVKFDTYDVQSKTITIETNVDWNITSKPFWLTIDQLAGNAGNHVITITSTLAPRDEKREATFKIIAADLSEDIFISQPGLGTITIDEPELTISKEDKSTKFTIETSEDWYIEHDDSWLKVSPLSGSAGKHEITATPTSLNMEPKERDVEINILSFGNKKKVFITQETAIDYYKDKDVMLIQQATIGAGVDLVFMGDGFTAKDLVQHKEGKYEKTMRTAIDYFFDIYPYNEYRAYFNIYMVVAESEEEGVDGEFKKVNNKFKTSYGEGTHISCDWKICKDYVKLIGKIKGESVSESDLNHITSIVILNSEKYAGTAWMYAAGFSICLCPMHQSFKNLVHHEAGGHGFGRLADEYVNYNESIHDSEEGRERISKLATFHSSGGYRNVDITNDKSDVIWKDFIDHPQYPNVGLYEGAYYYKEGVWRPEETSCMIDNRSYYNAPSRWLIVSRIMNIAGIDFTFEDFVKSDNAQKVQMSYTKALEQTSLPPLAPPVIILE